MFFRQVIGQDHIKESLLTSAKGQRVSHAQLFAGPDGSGSLAMAIAYAQYVSCLNKQENDSCGECFSCKKYAKLIHPDLHFVFPVVKPPKNKEPKNADENNKTKNSAEKSDKSKEPISDFYLKEWREIILENLYFDLDDWYVKIGSENAQGLIYSRESEEIVKKLNLKSFESEFKVMIIWMPEKMHLSCANKLLKMIEEPPVKTLFLLVAENEEDIISTIRSRCQLVKFPPIDDHSIKNALIQLPEAEGNNVENIVHLARGNYRKAIELLNPDENSAYNLDLFKELMRYSYGRKFNELFTWSAQLSGIGREKQKNFLLYALNFLRENFISNLKNNQLVFMDDEEQEFAKRFAPFINERNIIQLAEVFEDAYTHISMNGSARIIFTDVAFKITKLIKM